MNDLTSPILKAAIEVHRHFGPGLLESVYSECLCIELQRSGVPFEVQKAVPLLYRGVRLRSSFRLDLVVSADVVVEVKAVDQLARIHDAQVITYLKLTGCRVGLLLNFNVPRMKDGIRRLLNTQPRSGAAG